MSYSVVDTGNSRSFPSKHPLIEDAKNSGDVVIIIGLEPDKALTSSLDPDSKKAVLIELGTECLGVHTGESRGDEGSNVLGFARFRLGEDGPSDLVELVRQPNTSKEAVAVAKDLLESKGLHVAVCRDFAGRIIDRLVRPYYNAALRRLDEGLATADDLDKTLCLGLGYPEGPISLLERTGLSEHYDVSQTLFEAYGELGYVPARRARVGKQRKEKVDAST